MATVVVKTKRVCDMCGDEKKHFIDGTGETLTVNRGFIQSQSDQWEKSISARISASIPYHPCDDICTDCAREALEQMIRDIEK